MAICERCGCEFDIDEAKDEVDEDYGVGVYDSYYGVEYVCRDCAVQQIGADYATADEIEEGDL